MPGDDLIRVKWGKQSIELKPDYSLSACETVYSGELSVWWKLAVTELNETAFTAMLRHAFGREIHCGHGKSAQEAVDGLRGFVESAPLF